MRWALPSCVFVNWFSSDRIAWSVFFYLNKLFSSILNPCWPFKRTRWSFLQDQCVFWMLIVDYWSMFHPCAQPKVSLVYLSLFLVMAEVSTSFAARSLHPVPNLFPLLICFLVSLQIICCPFLSPPSPPPPFLPLCSSRRLCSLFQIQCQRGGCVGLRCWFFLCSRTYWSC